MFNLTIKGENNLMEVWFHVTRVTQDINHIRNKVKSREGRD